MRKRIYRAWDPQAKKFTQSGVQFNNTKMCLDCIPGIVLEDYIGQKDKNKEMLFEGDICRCKIENFDEIGVIEWVAKEFRYGWRQRNDFMWYEFKILEDGMEKIGNIHENPKLLKEIKKVLVK